MIWLAVLAYVAVGVFVYGWEFAWWRGEYADIAHLTPPREDVPPALRVALIWPVGLPAAIIAKRCLGHKQWHGWRLW